MMEHEEGRPDVKQAFTAYLADNGLRKSQERFTVLEAAEKMEGLFTAQELHAYITQDMKFHLSLTTVYATLDLLTLSGITVGHYMPSLIVKYEYAYGKTAFKYSICAKCGRISVIHDRTLDRTVSAVKTPRLHFLFYKTYIYGVCASCARKEKSKLRKIKNKDKL